MGSCFSSAAANAVHPTTAKVIALDGSLKEYAAPVTAADVLGPGHPSYFLCNSDRLLYDAYIPALEPTESLEPDQIYFVLPAGKLRHPLTGADMAALAVQGSSALALGRKRRGGKQRRIRVEPVEVVSEAVGHREPRRPSRNTKGGDGFRRRRTAHCTDGRFSRLSTIEEGDE